VRSAVSLFDLVLAAALLLLFGVLAGPGCERAKLRVRAHDLRGELEILHKAANRAALDAGIARGTEVPFSRIAVFLEGDSIPDRLKQGIDPLGNPYPVPLADAPPTFSKVSARSLREAVSDSFWTPFSAAESAPLE